MASEVQYVNCQELHYPNFTPQIVSPQSHVSSGCGRQFLEVTEAPNEELVLSLVNLSALANALPDSGSHLEIVQEDQSDILPEPRNPQLEAPNGQHFELPVSLVVSGTPVEAHLGQTSQSGNITGSCSVDIPPGSPSILVSPTAVFQITASSPEIAPERQSVLTRNGSHDVHSMPGAVAEHEAIAGVPTEATPVHDEPPTSDQDDDVQFILSVTRKRRRKRPRLDFLPGKQGKDASIDVRKDAPEHTSNGAGQGASLGSHTVGSNFTAAQSLPGPHLGMRNSQDHSSFPAAVPGSLLATGSSSAASIPKAPKQTTKKRKRNLENSLDSTQQNLGSTNGNNGLTFAKAPVHHHLQPPQHMCHSGPIFNVQHIATTQPTNNSQLMPGFGAYCPPHGLCPLGQQTRTHVVQPHMPILVGPVANTIPTSLASVSMSESLRRRPSLYAVPQWSAFPPSGSGMAIQAVPANVSRSAYQSPYCSRDTTMPGVSQVVPTIAGVLDPPPVGSTPSDHGARSAALQARNLQQPAGPPTGISTAQSGLSKQSHPPNMLVDIAQTCQDNFPFAIIAKRHNQPIQKVFDIFSAVIQLPLLRSAVDARRPGKLGSLRMKEFRAMKKGLKEMPKGEQVKKRGQKAGGDEAGGA